MEETGGFEATDRPAPEEGGADAAARFWRAFNRYDHGRCWFGETEEEEAGSAAMEWSVRGPARFVAERERARRAGGSRQAAKSPLPFGEAGVCGRAAYALQLLGSLYSLAEQVEAESRSRGWELNIGVLAYREPEDGPEREDEDEAFEEDLVTELDPEELAQCDTLVFWVEAGVPATAEGAWRLGDAFGRFIAGAGSWFERLDAGVPEALRSTPRLRGGGGSG